MSHRRRGHDERRRSSGDDDEPDDEQRSSRDSRDRDDSDRDRRRRHDSREREDRRDRDRDRRHRRDEPDDEERWRRAPLSDWYCRCGALNFRRRNTCHRQNCSVTRAQATGAAAGGAGITKRLALSGLDTRSGEESVVRALQASAPAAAARLTAVVLAPPGSGTCHLAYATVTDAMDAYAALLAARLRVNGRKVSVAYQPDVWPAPASTVPLAAEDVPHLAAYSARVYANTAQEQAQYLSYYTAYYSRQVAAPPTEADRVNAAAAVAQSAISQLQARATPLFTEERVYPTPDTSIYVYDESSGYYYDPSTGLYYDSSTQYYYNSQTGQYLYWNAAKMTYSPASSTTASSSASQATTAEASSTDAVDTSDTKKKVNEKQEKIKVAKKIAKDMERWAKTLNQKKDVTRTVAASDSTEMSAGGTASSSADIGFSVLESRGPPSAQPPPAPLLVPSYGAGSDSSGDEDEGIIDTKKLACLLCKRQFPSREVLEKHLKLSDLHRQNLEEFRSKNKPAEMEEHVYRDRAAERRMKYGEDDIPPPPRVSRVAESLPPPPTVREIGEENVGNRLLQKMGWSAGQGLGREGQGRVDPLEARAGPQGAGLGQKRGIYTAGPGETYRDCVKKLMIARYQDLVENEANT